MDQAHAYPKYRRLFLSTSAGTDQSNALLDCLHLLADPLTIDELKAVLQGRVEKWIGYQFKTDVYMNLLADLSASDAPKVRGFKTDGWVTCSACGKQITEGWEEGRIGEQAAIHYCYEHTEKEVS